MRKGYCGNRATTVVRIISVMAWFTHGTLAEISFEPFREFPTNSPSPWQVEAADMNGDGHVDLIVGGGLEIVSVMSGDGKGNFGIAIEIGLTFPWYDLRGFGVGDFNGDGTLDIAVTHSFPGKLSIWANDGAGVFSFAAEAAFNTDGTTVPALGDFDSDGDVDVVMVNYDVPIRELLVLQNDGTGGFQLQDTLALDNSTPLAPVVFDMDGDKDLDLVIGSNGNPDLQVWMNDASGEFTFELGFDATPHAIGVGDFALGLINDDDFADIFATAFDGVPILFYDPCGPSLYEGDDLLDIYLDDGVLTYGYVALNDLDSNGSLEAVIPIESYTDGEGGIQVLMHGGDGIYDLAGQWWTDSITNTDGAKPLLHDLDADGDTDVVTLDESGSTVGIWVNNSAEGNPPTQYCYADSNSDGIVDPLDAGLVLAQLGCHPCEGNSICVAADVNRDLMVDPLDVGNVLSRFGSCL